MLLAGLSDPRSFLGADAISYSEMTTLASCEKKWSLTYLGAKKETEPSSAMQLGTEMHKCLGAYHMTGHWWSDDETAQWLMGRYTQHYSAAAGRHEFLYVELPFAVKLPWGPYLFGWLDGLLWDHVNDCFWIAEFKTMGNWSKLEQLPVDKQITLYIWAARQMGYDVKGVMYDAIKTYRWTGKNADQHEPWESFERFWVTRTDEQIDECLAEIGAAMMTREAIQQNLRVPIRNVGQGCSWCACMPECYGLQLDVLPESVVSLDF